MRFRDGLRSHARVLGCDRIWMGGSMIITRTPLRITLGGVGTDLPSYYQEFGGFVLSAAINKYVYITINQTFFPGYLLKYSETELAETCGDIRHPSIREALRLHEMPARLEIVRSNAAHQVFDWQ